MTAVRRALISVSDKAGIVDLARVLASHGVELLSTGGTFRSLRDAGLNPVEVAEHTGFPEMLSGRVKTLHPKVHGGILFRRHLEADVQACRDHGIEPIDVVVVNLYPFEKTVAAANVAFEEAIEQIDIGGPSMIRSAAKNHADVVVLTDPSQYREFVEELTAQSGGTRPEFRRRMALAAFARTARYDAAIARFLECRQGESTMEDLFPQVLRQEWTKRFDLRYGENPHQRAALYVDSATQFACVAHAEQLHGKELSYNNLLDLDAALRLVREFDEPAAAVIKHNNPCGCAVADTLAKAFANAYAGDEVSAYGGILSFNRPVDLPTAEAIAVPGRFVEAIIAPAYDAAALELLTTKPSWRANVRILQAGELQKHGEQRAKAMTHRHVEGGMLRQSADLSQELLTHEQATTSARPSPEQLADLQLAWAVCKHVASNAIVLVSKRMLVGVGAGQMSRVDSVRIAIEKSAGRSKGAVLASDAFFPFRDGIDVAAAAGVVAIVQPGGSKRDSECLDACNEHGVSMLFTGVRHFRH